MLGSASRLAGPVLDDIELEYKFDWVDENGFGAGDMSAWQFVSLAAHGSRNLMSLGKVPEAVNINLTVRRPSYNFV